MSTRIIEANSLIYFKRFGFIRKSVLSLTALLFVSLILFSQFILYLDNQRSTFDNIVDGIKVQVQEKVKPLTLEERVLHYINKKNPNLSPEVSTELATSVVKESKLRDIPIKLLLGVIEVESQFQQFAISNTGAQGFMQIIARWHVDKIKKTTSKNLYAPAVNVAIGAETLRDCMDLHKSTEMSLLCYSGSQHDATKEYSKRVLKAAQSISLG